MRGLWLVARREIITRGTSKSYLISLAASVVLVVALVLVPGLLSSETRYTVALTGQDSVELEAAIDAASEGFDAFTVDVEQVDTPDEARNLVSEGEVDVAIVDNRTLITESGANQDLSLLLDSVHQQVGSQRQLSDAGFNVDDVQAALAVAPMEQEHLGGSDMGARIGFGYVLVIVLFFMVIMPVMYVATGVVEEKSSRIVEILLTSLKSWQLLGGKIVGLGVLGFLNLAVPLVVGLGIGGFTDSLDFLPTGVTSTLISAVVWWALAFAFYSALAGSLSSLVSRQEDINSAIGPMTMLMVVTYVVATIYVWDPTGPVTRILSFIPPFSVFMMPVRDIVNDAPVWQQLVSGAIMMVAVVAVLALGATIYKRSVMRTGSKIKLMDVLRKDG